MTLQKRNSIATAKVVLDSRQSSMNKEGLFPVCVRVISKRQNRLFSIGSYLSSEEFTDLQEGKQTKKLKEVRSWAASETTRAEHIIQQLGDEFTFARFKSEFKYNQPTKPKDVFGYFQTYVDDLRAEKRHSTADLYQTALNSLKSFRKTKMEFKEVDTSFLKKYGEWFLKGGENSESSLGIYLRSLRAVINQAIDEGLMKREQYPFGRGKSKYTIPTSRNIKKALTLTDIGKIANYKTKNLAIQKAKDLWLFSYLCNGMNMKDIAELRYKHLSDDGITFIRAKTKRSNLEEIYVPLLPQSQDIIHRWGNTRKNDETRVFDILPEALTPEKEVARRKQAIKTINKYMGRIATELGIEKEVKTYTARHSFATVLKRSGASVESISEALGHKSVKTTRNYLDSFEQEEKRKLQEHLVNF